MTMANLSRHIQTADLCVCQSVANIPIRLSTRIREWDVFRIYVWEEVKRFALDSQTVRARYGLKMG